MAGTPCPAVSGSGAERLWRSAHHGAATDADLERIAGLGLDRRAWTCAGPTERTNQPSRRPEGFGARVIDCDQGDQAEPPHVAFLRETDLSAQSARDFFLDYTGARPSSRGTSSLSPVISRPWAQGRLGADPLHGGQGPDGPAGGPHRTALLACPPDDAGGGLRAHRTGRRGSRPDCRR
jgi:hypothetical protein